MQCLKRANVSEEVRKKILAHVKAYKKKAADLRSAIETCLEAVATQDSKEDALQSLNSAVKASMDARVELLATVYGEMTAPEKCRIAACTIGV